MSADLHLHSACSDGIETPKIVVTYAKDAGLKTIALTDHDTVEGIPEALLAGKEMSLEVIPGVEFSTEINKTEIHILGYFVDYNNSDLATLLKKIQKGRKERIFKICEKLKKLDVIVDPEKILKAAGNDAPGRPHVARVLVEQGVVSTFNEAFNRFIDSRGPAYVAHYKLEPKECISFIKEIGGIAVFAHPDISNSDELIPQFVDAGLRGIEAYYPSYSEKTTQKYLDFAEKFGLLLTGGSDYHGINSGREIKLGEFSVDDSLVEKMRNEYLRRN
ncbi:MAG: PHP domain-containing protein [Candidatus Saganbacteria bacterium]|nr:PHP domain-containing protein [Candidatus Saganbacteria bacterium]